MKYFLDSTVSQTESCIVDEVAFLKEDVPRRAVPLLIDVVKRKTQRKQRAHLDAFARHFHMLASTEVTAEDAEELLTLLFVVQGRRDGHTNLQVTSNRQVSEISFRLLCKLYTAPHAHHATFLSALKGLLAALKLARNPERFVSPFASENSAAEQKRRLLVEMKIRRGVALNQAEEQLRVECNIPLAEVDGTQPTLQAVEEIETEVEPIPTPSMLATVEDPAVAHHVERGGIKLTEASFNLDGFLQSDDTRSHAVELLESLDTSGIDIAQFTESPWMYLPKRRTSECRVFRDFTYCTQRPKETQTNRPDRVQVHLKTNISMRSDVKYRFHFEGMNWGTNQAINCLIVGSAGLQWDRLGQMSYFGWPDGWDAATSACYTKGVDSVDHYFSSDGFVTVVLEARSLLNAGMSVTAWLTNHAYGNDFDLTATWHHVNERL